MLKNIHILLLWVVCQNWEVKMQRQNSQIVNLVNVSLFCELYRAEALWRKTHLKHSCIRDQLV